MALADLEVALALARARRVIDPDRIYAVGVSGGGMMALVAAARLSETWAAASAWVPVTDLARWHADSKARKNKYAGEIEKVCGGPPGQSAEFDAAYAARSVERLLAAGPPGCPLDINTGIHDGHTGSVPVGHAVRAFNAVVAPADRLSDAVIDELETTRAVPEAWRFEGADPLHASRPVLLRKTSGPARLTVLKGGHEIVHEAALTWLEAQARGQPPVWEVSPHNPPVIGRKAADSGK